MSVQEVSWRKRLASSFGMARGARAPREEVVREHAMPTFKDLAMYKSIRRYETVGGVAGIKTPFFRTVEGDEGINVTIEGKSYVNYAWCDYLGLNQHPSLRAAAAKATEEYGTCVSASRMVAGQTPLHLELEREIADFLGVDNSLLFVSGHAANVSTIGSIMSPGDLVVHDEFVHNSAVVGMRLSGATMKPFRHNDMDQLEKILKSERAKHHHVLVVIEGLYSTEGDLPDLARAIELKERFGAWLMVDDAHGLGVLGKSGKGVGEHFGIDGRKVDIWMGTLSKTLASCGGYIAGDKTLIEVLKHSAPGFVYSVGLPPSLTAAALAALRVIKAEPERVAKLHSHGRLFKKTAKELGLDTGVSEGYGMLPVIVGHGLTTVRAWHKVHDRGINPSLIIYPGVPMKGGRLRFFLTSGHSEDDIVSTLKVVKEELSNL